MAIEHRPALVRWRGQRLVEEVPDGAEALRRQLWSRVGHAALADPASCPVPGTILLAATVSTCRLA
jgi:hypothetical protein